MLCVYIDKQFKNVLQGIVSKTKTKQWVVILVDSYTCTLFVKSRNLYTVKDTPYFIKRDSRNQCKQCKRQSLL